MKAKPGVREFLGNRRDGGHHPVLRYILDGAIMKGDGEHVCSRGVV